MVCMWFYMILHDYYYNYYYSSHYFHSFDGAGSLFKCPAFLDYYINAFWSNISDLKKMKSILFAQNRIQLSAYYLSDIDCSKNLQILPLQLHMFDISLRVSAIIYGFDSNLWTSPKYMMLDQFSICISISVLIWIFASTISSSAHYLDILCVARSISSLLYSAKASQNL